MARRRSWLTLWRNLPSRVWRILKSPQVTIMDKLLFVGPVLLYWIAPDLMPLLPIDDAAFTVIAARLYASAMERKYGERNR